MKLNPVERVDFFDIMQCLGEKKQGEISGKKLIFFPEVSKAISGV